MFTELLSLTAAATVLIAAFMEGKRGGALGILIGLLIGIAAGFGVFWTTRKAIRLTCQRHGLYEAKLPLARLTLAWGLILAAFVWMGVAGVTVIWLMRSIVRHL